MGAGMRFRTRLRNMFSRICCLARSGTSTEVVDGDLEEGKDKQYRLASINRVSVETPKLHTLCCTIHWLTNITKLFTGAIFRGSPSFPMLFQHSVYYGWHWSIPQSSPCHVSALDVPCKLLHSLFPILLFLFWHGDLFLCLHCYCWNN